MFICSSVFLSLDSTRIALHDLQIKLILIYLIQSLCVAPSVHPLSQDILVLSLTGRELKCPAQ